MSLSGPELVGSRVVWFSGTSMGAGRKSARRVISTQIPTSISSKVFFSFSVATLAQAFGLEIYTLLSTSSLSDQHRVTDLPPRTRVPSPTSPSISIDIAFPHPSLSHPHTLPPSPRRSLTIYSPLHRN